MSWQTLKPQSLSHPLGGWGEKAGNKLKNKREIGGGGRKIHWTGPGAEGGRIMNALDQIKRKDSKKTT